MPFLPPNQQRQSTEGRIRVLNFLKLHCMLQVYSEKKSGSFFHASRCIQGYKYTPVSLINLSAYIRPIAIVVQNVTTGILKHNLSHDQLRAASLIGRNVVTWRRALSNVHRVTVDRQVAIVWHFQPRVVIFQCPTHYLASSVKCPLVYVYIRPASDAFLCKNRV